MPYGLKYTASATGQSHVEWRVELLKKDYTGDPTGLLLMGDGIRIGHDREEDRFTPIFSRYAEISLKATLGFQLDDIQFDDERAFQVIIYKGNDVEFVGWLVPFYSSEDFEDLSAVIINVMAKDTINQLSNVTFFNRYPERANNRQSFKEVISLALKQLGYYLYLEIYYNKYDHNMYKEAMDCPLSQLYFNVDTLQDKDGVWLDFYTVLERLLLQHDLRLFQAKGKWIIISPIELADGSVTGRRFEPESGFYMGTVTLNSDVIIHTGGLKVLKNTNIRKDRPIQSYTSIFEYGLLGNLVANGNLLRFEDGVPNNWTKGGDWSEGEITDIIGGGVMFDRTYLRKVGLQVPTETSPDPVFVKNQYLISDQINISLFTAFKFQAEVYADDDIDEIRITLRLTDISTGGKVYYVDKAGKVYSLPTSIFIQKGTENKGFSVDVAWNNLDPSFDFGLRNTTVLEVLIYPGIRYRSGEPSNQHVKFKKLQLTGTPYAYDANYIGRKYQYSNTALPSSKKTDPHNVYFQDNEIYDLSLFNLRSSLFVGETATRTTKWKRTTEANAYSIVESVLIDRLAQTSRFGDIFEGKVRGEINLLDTPYLSSNNKRFLVLFAEYNLQRHETELLATELYSNDISFSFKKIDLFKDNKEIDVSDGTSTSSLGTGEKFDTPITSNGDSVKYGGLYTDGGIDSLPEDSNDPKAKNKGKLLLGVNNAIQIALGSSKTLIQLLGTLGFGGDNYLFRNYLPEDETIDGLVLKTGKSGLWLPDGSITAQGFNIWDVFRISQTADGSQTTMIASNKIYQQARGFDFKATDNTINFFRGNTRVAVINDGGLGIGTGDLLASPLHVNSNKGGNQQMFTLSNGGLNIKPTSFAVLLNNSDDTAKIISAPIDASVMKWTFGEADFTGLVNFTKAPTSAINATADNELVRWGQVKDPIVEYGQIQAHEQYQTVDAFNNANRFGFAFVNGSSLGTDILTGKPLPTGLPNEVRQGTIIKLGIGNEYPDQYHMLFIPRPFNDYNDGNIYIKGVYGGVIKDWSALGGSAFKDYPFEEGELKRDYYGAYLEVEEGDKHAFIGIDKIKGGFVVNLNTLSFDDDSSFVTQNWFRPDGRLVRVSPLNGKYVEDEYVLKSELVNSGSGGSIFSTVASPLLISTLSGGTKELGIAKASQTTNGYLSSADWTVFNRKFDLPSGGNFGDVLVRSANGNGTEWATLVIGSGGITGALSPLFINGNNQVYINKADAETDGYLSASDYQELVRNYSRVGFLSFDSYEEGINFNRDPLSNAANAKIYIQQSTNDLIIATAGNFGRSVRLLAADYVELKTSSTSIGGAKVLEVIIGTNSPDYYTMINGQKFNAYLASPPTNGAKYVWQYNSTTGIFNLVPA